jgi:hypothetical protein
VIRDASPAAMRSAHGFVDKKLSRSKADWDRFEIPEALRDLADDVWELMLLVAQGEETSGADGVEERLDAARTSYTRLYEEAEAIAQSSISAARRQGKKRRVVASRTTRVMRRMPKRYRRKIPLRWRVAVARAIQRSNAAR